MVVKKIGRFRRVGGWRWVLEVLEVLLQGLRRGFARAAHRGRWAVDVSSGFLMGRRWEPDSAKSFHMDGGWTPNSEKRFLENAFGNLVPKSGFHGGSVDTFI